MNLPLLHKDPSPYNVRRTIAKDTVERSTAIVNSTPGASLESILVHAQLPSLPTSTSTAVPIPDVLQKVFPAAEITFPSFPPSQVRVINSDAYTIARELISDSPEFKLSTRGADEPFTPTPARTAVLNLASDLYPGGGWTETLSKTQEEALCYSSTLYNTLNVNNGSYYPWASNLGPRSATGIISPAVVIFRSDLDSGLKELEKKDWRLVNVLSVAGLRGPPLTADQQEFLDPNVLVWLREKVRLVYRMAAWSGCWDLVLGAIGCGAYRCPPKAVAREMKAVLLEPEFSGWFRNVVFAVYSKKEHGNGNFDTFKDALDGLQINVGQ
ncbi:hypothetical protein BV22DRAFT_1024458 [Leucogyrophana mollusca]|uniref:Uncharacterized protein n=1 Tax=Leucogyrophana mollusca TaxID=85980 RepID=A0ACB8AZ14_9AGAM|nr:hypothetical protein BV22DRAFT_1024458 [Leucogyrophana mollusca]